MTIPVTPIIPVSGGGGTISLKEFKKMIKSLGYKVKTYVSGYYTVRRCLEVLDKDGNFIVGHGANVYAGDFMDKHRAVFDLLREYRGRVFDEEGDKVLF